MPWKNPLLDPIIERVKEIILKEFNKQINVDFYTASKNELINKVMDTFQLRKLDNKSIERLKYNLQYIHGKYFSESNEIWLVESKGEIFEVILHESLHSIQLCNPNREGIVDYLTHKLSNNIDWIDNYTLENWIEIEKQIGIHKIKKKLLSIGDCEEFDN